MMSIGGLRGGNEPDEGGVGAGERKKRAKERGPGKAKEKMRELEAVIEQLKRQLDEERKQNLAAAAGESTASTPTVVALMRSLDKLSRKTTQQNDTLKKQ